MAAAALLPDFHIVQSLAFGCLSGSRSEVLHLVGRAVSSAVLFDLLEVHPVAVRKPGVIAGPAPNGDQHVLFIFIIVSVYSFSVH